MHLNEYVKAVAYFEAQHVIATSLKLAHVQSDAALNMGVALTLGVRAARQGPVAGADQAPGPLSSVTHRRAWMIECVRRQSGSWLPSMVVKDLHDYTWRTSPSRRGKRTQRWHMSKSTSRWLCKGDVTLAPGVGRPERGHADAHVQRLPCSEVLQSRSPKDGFEKSRIGRESDDRAAQGYLRSAPQVARGCQRLCGA
jgi:hypothetical protein